MLSNIIAKPISNTNIKTKSTKILLSMYKHRWFYVLLAPILTCFTIFNYRPMYGVLLAFKDFSPKGISASPWVGFKHFERMFDTPAFWEVTVNTLIISCLKIIFMFPAPIILALLINEIPNIKFKKVVQTASYLPYFFSWVVLAGMITELLSPSRGVINYILTLFGREPIYFLTEPSMFRSIVVITAIWQSVGWGTIIYLAAIAGVDAEQFEAAYIDGASRFKIVRHIVIPSIMPVISIVFILNLGSILNAGFDQIFNLYNPLVYPTGDIIDTYVYRQGLKLFDYSYSTAVNLFKNLIGFILVIMTNYIAKKVGDGENALW